MCVCMSRQIIMIRKLAVVSRDDCVRIGGNGAKTKPILRHTGIFFIYLYIC